MYRSVKIVIIAAIVVCSGLPELATAGAIQEGWYRMRSRDNMKIGNYAAAIEAYEKYLELKPNDREALKGIALAYEKQGETDKAIARYDKYLELYKDDAEIAFKQANFLIWSRYAYRRKDAIRYFKMGLEQQDDPTQRLKFAQLLAQNKSDLDAAVEQYEILLKQDPENQSIRKKFRKLLLWDDRYLAKAIKQYEYYVDRTPNDFKARRQLAILLGKSDRRKDEGVAIYAQLVSEKPGDNALRREYARLLAITPGKFDEAKHQYSILMKNNSDSGIKAETAKLLEQEQSYRGEALKLYSQILKAEPNNRDIRMRRASIYMDDKSSAAKALKDYEYILKSKPTDAGAHRGAAEALAWLERPDDALYHAKLARKYSKNDRTSRRLYGKLAEGREPRIATFLELPDHRGDKEFELRGSRFGVTLSGDVSPYFTLGAAAGSEKYRGDSDEASGGWWQINSEYRLNPRDKVNVAVENHDIREEGITQTFALSYTHSNKPPQWSYTLGYGGHIVSDSFLSLVGDAANAIGGATRHELYAFFSRGDEQRMMTFRPAAGWVESASESNNEFFNLSGTLRLPFSLKTRFKTFYGVDMTVMSYAKDHSGFADSSSEPESGGYFSPQKFFATLLYADVISALGESGELTLKLGPKLQLVDDASVSNESSSGFFASLSYTHKKNDSLYFALRAEYDRIADLYRSALLRGELVYIF